ncbi:MAG: trehalose-phosphatase [Noviherbaspirillum sp.]
MTPLFSDTGMLRLDQVVGGRLLCAFDFDGTLAPIVALPEQARLPEEIRQRLVALSAHAPIAIITGRSVQDIRGRLGFEPEFVVGNHGLEGVPGWEAQAARHQELCSAWRAQLGAVLCDPACDPAIQLEDKRYSLSVHYRLVRDTEETARRLEYLFTRLKPHPRVVSGKYVFNLLAEDTCHKGSALSRLIDISGARHAIYVGDDITDEDVFRLRRDDVVSIRIERAADSAADFFLPYPCDILVLLEELIKRLRALGVHNWIQPGPPAGFQTDTESA